MAVDTSTHWHHHMRGLPNTVEIPSLGPTKNLTDTYVAHVSPLLAPHITAINCQFACQQTTYSPRGTSGPRELPRA